ncbi:S1 family peptidase [Streptomyces sp. GMY02]|uniref:S1 family peptidase n=1 Tax=Streptomyces sp. GMY02 TaxID=1333528 RepID=UPI001C2C4DA5|nr:S1 family peptidase [Streptomyces sp. GMY02]QXE38674.1 S1 family peptidase [Streptomyces sp. GMY02]
MRNRCATRVRSAAVAGALTALAAGILAPGPANGQTAARTFSVAELNTVRGAVLEADVAGTAWSADPATGKVLVSVDETVSDQEIGHIRRTAGELAGALKFERIPGELATAAELRKPAGEMTPFVKGGEYIYGFDTRASLGFNTVYNGRDYFVTAGHCTKDVSHWYLDSSLTTSIGPTVGSSYPGNDYGVVRYDNSTIPRPGTVRCGQTEVDITGSTEPRVGMPFNIAGYNCRPATVQALNVSVNYADGAVHGLFRANGCAAPGDSGAASFSGSLALGLLSGGTTSCTTSGITYWQPVNEVLTAYGLTLT